MNKYDKRVADGIRFLDAVRPGWREKINLDTLDLNSGFDCIIGQVFGSYVSLFFWIGMDDQGEHVDHKFASALGFNIMDTGRERYTEIAHLENAWRDALKV